MIAPPSFVVDEAVRMANASPCAKSKRGVVIWRANILAAGYNAQPAPFRCDGSQRCKDACGELCEHAERAALRGLVDIGFDLEMLHVKTVDGLLVPSGGPSCPACSNAILSDGRIAGMWLYHVDGWRRYDVQTFHELSCKARKLPVIRG